MATLAARCVCLFPYPYPYPYPFPQVVQDRKGQPTLAINFDDKTTQLFKEVRTQVYLIGSRNPVTSCRDTVQ